MTGAPTLPALVDSHAHLDMEEFDPDREEVVLRAFAAGVVAILCPADLTRERSPATILALRERHPEISAAAGVHPHQAKDLGEDHFARLRRLADGGLIRAVGEIGLDYHYDLSPRDSQMRAFRRQLSFAQESGLPVLVHSRLSGSDIIAALDAEGFTKGGILHCFTENQETARAVIERGFYVSFSGILTFPKAGDLREVAAALPLDRLLVETDSPYLAPVPFRGSGRRNEPAFVAETARALAEVRKISLAELARATTGNFERLFPFEKSGARC